MKMEKLNKRISELVKRKKALLIISQDQLELANSNNLIDKIQSNAYKQNSVESRT